MGRTAQAAVDLATMTGEWSRRQAHLESAMDQATDECMRAHGFAVPASVSAPRNWDEAVAVDLPRRRLVGYGLNPLSPPDVATEPPSATDDFLTTLSPQRRSAYSAVLLGTSGARLTVRLPGGRVIETPLTGCVAAGREKVFGSVQSWATAHYVPEAINSTIDVGVAASPSYTTALRLWRACMTRKGIRAENPVALRSTIETAYSRNRAGTPGLERQVAVADGECALESHLGRAALTARRDLLQTSLDPNRRQLLDQATRLWLDASTRASAA